MDALMLIMCYRDAYVMVQNARMSVSGAHAADILLMIQLTHGSKVLIGGSGVAKVPLMALAGCSGSQRLIYRFCSSCIRA